MARTLNENMKQAGKTMADTAKNVGETIADGAQRATMAVKEMTGLGPAEGSNVGVSGITEHMRVIGACGSTVGVVDGVENGVIKLTRKDSPDGQHHFVPFGWVDHVDNHVHLNMNSMEVQNKWRSEGSSSCGTSCGCNS